MVAAERAFVRLIPSFGFPCQPPGRRSQLDAVNECTTRDAILDAARDLFFEEGLHRTSMRSLANRVGLAQSSLYNHFPTKEALVIAVMERSFELVDGTVRAVFESAPPSLDLLHAALHAHALQHIHGIKETMVFEVEGRHMSPVMRQRIVELRSIYEHRFYDLAERLVAAGCLDPTDLVTRVRMLLTAGTRINGWFRPGGALTEEQVAEIYANFGLASLGVPNR